MEYFLPRVASNNPYKTNLDLFSSLFIKIQVSAAIYQLAVKTDL